MRDASVLHSGKVIIITFAQCNANTKKAGKKLTRFRGRGCYLKTKTMAMKT
jgi:hypothetical protein